MPYSKRKPRPLVPLVAGVLLALLAFACDAERDLAAYFGTPAPSPALTQSPDPAPTASPTVRPTPSPLPSPSPSPTPQPTPSPTTGPTSGATGSPSPTRPPNLPPIGVLRERAAVVPYQRLLAQPGRFMGELLFFDGRVQSVSSDEQGSFRARVRVAGSVFIHLTYEARSYWGQPLVAQDRIRVVGYFRGLSDSAAHGERVPVLEVYDLHLRFT